MKQNILLTCEYDGTAYCGWQTQPSGGSVQQALETALTELFQRPIACCGCSRTDAGVHALAYCVNFFVDTNIPVEKIPFAALPFLPEDISIKSAKQVPEEFHAQYQAKAKTYRYRFYTAPTPSPLLRERAWYVKKELKLAAMQEAATHYVGEKEFDSFCAVGGTAKTTKRTMLSSNVRKLEERKDGFCSYEFEITGTGFLYNMVRIMTGTLVDVGHGRFLPEEIPEIIRAKDRTKAGMTAPAHGLYLAEVHYEEG